MAKLNMKSEKPSDEVVKKAQTTYEVTDDRGRIITLKKPGVLAQYRLIEALGDTAKNSTYTSMVLPLIYISQIDDKAVFVPQNKLQVEALIQELDDEGIKAVMDGVMAHFGDSDPEADKEALKN